MAVTIASVAREIDGNGRKRIVDITGPASYTTGGETVSAAQYVAMGGAGATAASFTMCVSETNPAGYTVSHDRTNGKILFFLNGTQVTSTTDIHTVTVRAVLSYGIVNGS